MDTDKTNKKTGGKRPCKFSNGWLLMKEFEDWLEKSPHKKGDSDLAFCKFCNCTMTAHKSELIRHKHSNKHKKNEAKVLSGMDSAQQNEITQYVTKAETNLSSFIEEHKLPTHVTESLVPLCKNIFPDSNIATKIVCKRTITTQNIKKTFPKNLDILYTKLKVPGMFFSIYMDETTDQSAIKKYTLTAVFMDGENGVRYSFFDMFKASGLPRNLCSSLKSSITSKGIPFENLVGFSSDTTDVMVGEDDSVFSHLKNDCVDIACIKGSCHTIHLAASKACLKLPIHVEDLLRNLGLHFSSNYGTQQCFEEFQQFFHVDIHNFLSKATTRWLTVKECVERVLEQYDPLLAYFQQNCIDDPPILDTMNNYFTKAYIQFMSYILGVLYEFNKMFRAQKPLLHKMKPEVEKLLQDIYLNFLRTDYVRKTPTFEIDYTDLSYHLPLYQIYLGISASETISNLQAMADVEEKDIESFYENILNFYLELVTVVTGEFDFCDELFNIIPVVVDPQVAQDFKITSLVDVWRRFPGLKKFIDIQGLDNEWKKHALLDHDLEGLDPGVPADDYWQKVFKIQTTIGTPAFPNLCIVMKLLLVLPFFPAQVLKESLRNC